MFTNQLPSATYQYLHPNTIKTHADSITLNTDSTTAIIAFIHQHYASLYNYGRDKTANYSTFTIAFAGDLKQQYKIGIFKKI